MKRGAAIALSMLACSSLAGLAPPSAHAGAPERPAISVLSIGSPVDLYDTGRDGCGPQDVPDMPARAFRDKAGLIHFFATQSINRPMLGKDFDRLVHTCTVAFKGALNTNPAAYDDNGWLVAFYARGNDVFALIHNEFHGSERPDLCPSSGGANCTEVAITEAASTDGGNHFARYPGDTGLVAALPYKFRVKRGEFIGYMNPSNIIRRGDDYFVLVTAIDPYDSERSGVCLLRTRTLADPRSWRAWDGNDFVTSFINPYRTAAADPAMHACKPVAPETLFFSLGSIAWSAARSTYVLVERLQHWDHGRHGETQGAYLFESADLIHWSGPTLLFSDEQAGGLDQLYPSLIDPASADANFGTIGAAPILYTKIATPGQGYSGWKLLARKLRLGL